MPLGIDFIEILLHVFNFIILLLGIRFLLYKPIKKFMTQRESEYRSAEEEKKAMKAQTKLKNEEAERSIKDARQKAVQIAEEASQAAEIQKEEIIKAAKQQAAEIIESAKLSTEKEQAVARKELQYSISELAVEIASRILEREIKPEDNDTIINTLIEEWKVDA